MMDFKMTKDEAMKLALEALENVQYYGWGQTERDYDARTAAITALRKALALVNEVDQEQPAQQEPVDSTQISKVWWDGEKLMAKPIPFVEFYKPAPAPEVREQQKPVPDWISYNKDGDVLVIHGRRYSAALFDERGFGAPPGTLLRIVDGPSDAVTLERVAEQPAQTDWEAVAADQAMTIALLRAEQPQQEPAGWRPATFHRDNLTFNPGLPYEQTVKFWKLQGVEIEYCYTSPPAQRKPLTETEIRTLRCDLAGTLDVQYVTFARAIEAAHGIKEKT